MNSEQTINQVYDVVDAWNSNEKPAKPMETLSPLLDSRLTPPGAALTYQPLPISYSVFEEDIRYHLRYA